jgi:two-component system, NarL family, sensor kinase
MPRGGRGRHHLPASAAVLDGERGTLPLLALTTGSFAFLPVAVQGLVNVRFPTGRPASRAGAVLEIAIATGTALVLVGGFLGSSLGGATQVRPDVRHPFTDGTAVGSVADGLVILARSWCCWGWSPGWALSGGSCGRGAWPGSS